jgi:hypothetical protein
MRQRSSSFKRAGESSIHTSNSMPCAAHVVLVSAASGPRRRWCVDVDAKNAPSRLKTVKWRPPTSTMRPLPGGSSLTSATRMVDDMRRDRAKRVPAHGRGGVADNGTIVPSDGTGAPFAGAGDR